MAMAGHRRQLVNEAVLKLITSMTPVINLSPVSMTPAEKMLDHYQHLEIIGKIVLLVYTAIQWLLNKRRKKILALICL